MRRGIIVMARKTGDATIVPLFKQKVVLAAEASSNVQAERDFIDENVHRWRGRQEMLFACAATKMAFTQEL